MPIIPIGGEIESQPLNDNFSYLDSEVSKANGQLPGQTQLTYSGGQLTKMLTPSSTITFSYTETRLTQIVEEEADRTITTTLNYTDNKLTSMDTEVTEHE